MTNQNLEDALRNIMVRGNLEDMLRNIKVKMRESETYSSSNYSGSSSDYSTSHYYQRYTENDVKELLTKADLSYKKKLYWDARRDLNESIVIMRDDIKVSKSLEYEIYILMGDVEIMTSIDNRSPYFRPRKDNVKTAIYWYEKAFKIFDKDEILMGRIGAFSEYIGDYKTAEYMMNRVILFSLPT